MPTTLSGFYYPDTSASASIETLMAAAATSQQGVIDDLVLGKRQIQTYKWANSTARLSQTGMAEGDMGFQLSDDSRWYYNGTQWVALYSSGLVPIIPTSVAGSGVGMDTSTGIVSFTTSSSVSVNGCFTSLFRNYMCIASVTARSVNSFSRLYLRATGTNLTTGYDLVRTVFGATVTTGQLANNADIPMGSTNAASQNYTIDFRQPQLAAQTGYNTKTLEAFAAAAPTSVISDGSTRLTSAYDGFTIDTAAGTMNGVLRVYGYN